MKTLFVMVGIPGADQLNTVKTLEEALKQTSENNVTVWSKDIDIPNRYYDCNNNAMLQMRHEVYKWAQETGEHDYGIVNIPFLTAFDRYDFIDEIDKAGKIANNELIIVAIYHERSYRYLYDRYAAGEEKLQKDKQIMLTRYVRRMQQPIREEGFDLIYRIGGKDDLNMSQLTKMMSKITDDPFWTVTTEETPNEEE